MKIQDTAQKHLQDQRQYVKDRHLEDQRKIAGASGTTGLVDEKMLAQTMRSVRYADEGHAAGDIIDNSIESGASQVHLAYDTAGSAIQQIAFIDDGSGIDPTFLPHATKWGGSSNDGKRNVFGRFGFGLPSASVNRGTKFSVYSRTDSSEDFNCVTVDLENLSVSGQVVALPKATVAPLPKWVSDYVTARVGDGEVEWHGGIEAVRTVVVWSNLDRLKWKNKQASTAGFREHLGITYAGWLNVCSIAVDHQKVEPVDVLFTTPDARWYDIEGFPKADPHESIRIEVEDSDGARHPITVRFSYLSVDAHDATVATGGRGRPKKIRQAIRKEYNGFFVTRNGRFIELARPDEVDWSVYARQVGVAIDFPPALDELFGVTPDKQTIVFSERVISILTANNVFRAFKTLTSAVSTEREVRRAARLAEMASGDGKRPSEETIAKVVSKDVRRTRKVSDESQAEGERNFKERVKRMADETGLPEEQIAEVQQKIAISKPYAIEFRETTEDMPFYTPKMDNTQTVLEINTAHPWYREVYLRLADNAEMRSALELMLFVLGTCELDSTDLSRNFYRNERREWSNRMADAFDLHRMVFSGAKSKQEVEDDDPSAWAEDEGDITDEGEAEAS